MQLLNVILPQGEVLLGRSVGCFLQVDDPKVSRVHLRLLVTDKVVVEDLESANGTHVNGEPLEGRRELVHADVITVGDHAYRVKLDARVTNFEPEEETPVSAEGDGRAAGGGTHPGLGAVGPSVEQSCPSCGHQPVPFNAATCPGCGRVWPRGRPNKPTDRVAATPTVRQHQRYAVELRARYASPATEVKGLVSNLSISGVFITTSEVDPVGTPCSVSLVAGEGQPRSLRGFVRHVIHRGVQGRAGMGIEFAGLNHAETGWLTELMERSWRAGD